MQTLKVLLTFVLYSVRDKVTFFRHILEEMTANPLYPTPDVSLAEAKLAIDHFEAAILAAQDGSHTAISLMHDSEKACTLLFRHIASYVNRIANGDESKILSSGFHCSTPYPTRDKPVLAITDGSHSGSAIGTNKSVPKAGSYVWEINKAIGWVQVAITTQTTYLFEGLLVGSVVEFRSAAVTPEGITDFCAPVSKLIN